MEEEKKPADDELIDFSKIKNKVKGLFKGQGASSHPAGSQKHPHQSSSSNQENDSGEFISADFKQIKNELKKNAKWLIPLLCILIAMTASIYLRTMPQRLPIADDWAENSVYNFYRSQLQSQIDSQYPNLPPQNKNTLVEKEWQKYLKDNRDTLKQQTGMIADQYRNSFKDDNGTLYLLGIDPYYYYRQAYYVLHNGYPGSDLKDGTPWDYYRLAPLGREAEWNFHHWFGAVWHRFLNLFGDFPLMLTFFFVGTIFSALTVIPAFFIGKRITKNDVGGFFTALLIAVSAFFVSRTTGESSDTDVYAVFFPVLIAWLFIESVEAKDRKWKFARIVAAGFATGVFAFAWTGWWYIATFLLATMIFQLGFLVLTHWKALFQTVKSKIITEPLSVLGTYLLSAAVFVSIFTSFDQLVRVVLGPFQFLSLKAVAVTNYWPNIRTTVAELNVVSLSNVIGQLGGKLLFTLALAGILLVLFRKDREGKRDPQFAFLFALWLGASLFATTKGVRFILQATPIVAIALGSFLGLSWAYASGWVSRELKFNLLVTKILVFLLLALLLIQPIKDGYSQAFHSAPSMNDAWYDTLSKIRNEAPEDIVITSWWDFGHWFKAVADRPVTFDGGTQTSWGAYWVGKSLLTDDEKNSIGIVRMLNCGQNNAFKELNKKIADVPETIDILNIIVAQDKNTAIKTLQKQGLSAEEISAVTLYTHCDAPEDYYITSEDMIGKAGVWGHFGSWNFKKAVMYLHTKNLGQSDAISKLMANLSVSETTAKQYYTEIKTTSADNWIAPWPGYMSGPQGCEKNEKELRCSGSIQDRGFVIRVDLETYNTTFENNPGVSPNSIVYAAKQGIIEKEFSGERAGFSIILVPDGENYYFIVAAPQQAASMFTKLYFLNGHGLDCFRKFDEVRNMNGGKIVTWVVDYACQEKNLVFFVEPPETETVPA